MAPHTRPHVVLVEPSGARRQLALDCLPFRIGRETKNSLCLPDSTYRISRRHAVIWQEDDRYLIRDEGSRHGTFVNGERLEAPRALQNNDRVEFGIPNSYTLIFVSEEESLQHLLERVETPLSDTTPRELRNLNLLLEVARVSQSGLSLEHVLGSVVDACLKVTGAERGFLFLGGPGQLYLAVGRDRARQSLSGRDFHGSLGVIDQVLRGAEDIIIADVGEHEDLRERPSVIEQDLRSVICLALREGPSPGTFDSTTSSPRGEPLGVIYLDSHRAGRPVSEIDREVLASLALDAARVIENARLFDAARTKDRLEREVAIARQIQSALLPGHFPRYPGFDVAGVSLPSQRVGGDYFDLLPMPGGRCAVVMADVSGKGIPAALLSCALQGMLAALIELEQPIEAMARQLNRFICRHEQVNRLVTFFCGFLDPGGFLDYVNAGHVPPLLLGSRGDARLLRAANIPLGLREEENYAAASVTLEPGDLMVLYTDGVIEAENTTRELYGLDRFCRMAGGLRRAPAEQVVEHIVREVRAFSREVPPEDDMTLLVVRYEGKA